MLHNSTTRACPLPFASVAPSRWRDVPRPRLQPPQLPSCKADQALAVRSKIPATPKMIDQRFSHERAARIPRAEDQHLQPLDLHQPQHPEVFSDGSQHSGVPTVSGVQQALSACPSRPENSSASSIVRYVSHGIPEGACQTSFPILTK